MKTFENIKQIVESYNELGETIEAACFLIEEYKIKHPNFKAFELREKADPSCVLLTTEGNFGEPQIIRIPDNIFDFPLELILTLIAHEMIHVGQRELGAVVEDRNEREWQAYYEMIFHKTYPQIPNSSNFHLKFYANKGLQYYQRMGEGSELQKKYASQKSDIEIFIASLK